MDDATRVNAREKVQKLAMIELRSVGNKLNFLLVHEFIQAEASTILVGYPDYIKDEEQLNAKYEKVCRVYAEYGLLFPQSGFVGDLNNSVGLTL